MARPKQQLISQDWVVEAATRILEQDGPDALSLRRIASELGVTSASLYHHFSSKDEILMAVVRTALRDTNLPVLTEKWDDWICEAAVEYRRLLIRRPFLIPLILQGTHPRTVATAVTDAKLGEIGVPPEVRAEFLLWLDTTVVAWALVSINTPAGGGESAGLLDHEALLRGTIRQLLRDMIAQYRERSRKPKRSGNSPGEA